MNSQEKQMILELADRVESTSLEAKDPEADKLIQTHIAEKKNAVYIMTQALLVQQQALAGLQERVRQLEMQLQSGQKKKGFLGNLFGAGRTNTSNNQPYGNQNTVGNNGFQRGPSGYNSGSYGPSPYAPSAGSSFLGSAMSTAVGVAGGMALFNGLEHLFSHGSNVASTATDAISGSAADSFLGDGANFQGQEGLLDQGFGQSGEMDGLSSGFDSPDIQDDSMDFGGGFDDSDFGNW